MAAVGFIWAIGVVQDSQFQINQLRDLGAPRPSSYHPGGVVASFCDGHQQFLSENIDYLTYEHLMTPDSESAGKQLAASGNPPRYTDWVNRSLQDQFSRGLPPLYDPAPQRPKNLANTVLDLSQIQ